MTDPTVLLVSMPWRTPSVPSLALATLRPLLARAGIASEELYGTLLFPRTDNPFAHMDLFSTFLFVPALHPPGAPEATPDALFDLARARFADEVLSHASLGLDAPETRAALREDFARAETCLARCFERVAAGDHDIVGFSLTFETQAAASLALARRIKAALPEKRVLFGGAACIGETGAALARAFPEIDAVCTTEGEDVIVPLVRALRGDPGDLSHVPGVAYRAPDGRVRTTPAPPRVDDLDALPEPDYDDFIAAHAESDWADLPVDLLFETSRGCWWAEKRPCHFCGLNAYGHTFRTKSPERAFDELTGLHTRYPTAKRLMATDNALDRGYLDTLMPRLAGWNRSAERPLRLLFELRTQLRREEIATLAAAGVAYVQPGIESFDDELLRRMNKGGTALGNVQLLKGLLEHGVQPLYNVLLDIPGEEAAHYDAMTALVPFIEHLPPPGGVLRMILMRHSTYWRDASRFGLREVRPKPYYDTLYPTSPENRAALAYHFDFDLDAPPEPALVGARERFYRAAVAWQDGWQPWRAFRLQRDERTAFAVDRRRWPVTAAPLAGAALAAYEFLDRTRPAGALERHQPDCEPAFLRCSLAVWRHRRWLVEDTRGRSLAVLPRRRTAG